MKGADATRAGGRLATPECTARQIPDAFESGTHEEKVVCAGVGRVFHPPRGVFNSARRTFGTAWFGTRAIRECPVEYRTRRVKYPPYPPHDQFHFPIPPGRFPGGCSALALRSRFRHSPHRSRQTAWVANPKKHHDKNEIPPRTRCHRHHLHRQQLRPQGSQGLRRFQVLQGEVGTHVHQKNGRAGNGAPFFVTTIPAGFSAVRRRPDCYLGKVRIYPGTPRRAEAKE